MALPLGSLFVWSLTPLADLHTLRWKELRPTLPSPCSWQRPWGGDRSGQQWSALSLPGSGSQLGSESGLMGQPPALMLLQATSTGGVEHMLLCLKWTVARQAPLSKGFFVQNGNFMSQFCPRLSLIVSWILKELLWALMMLFRAQSVIIV